MKKTKYSDLFDQFDRQASSGLWETVQGEEELEAVQCNTRKDRKERKNAKSAGLLTYLWPCGVILRTMEAFRSETNAQVRICPNTFSTFSTLPFGVLLLGDNGIVERDRPNEPIRAQNDGISAL